MNREGSPRRSDAASRDDNPQRLLNTPPTFCCQQRPLVAAMTKPKRRFRVQLSASEVRAPGCSHALSPDKKTADFRRFLVELAGLEPATSWVRSPRCANRFSA
jgi:hypothetical protein